jgi:hypothetical protein
MSNHFEDFFEPFLVGLLIHFITKIYSFCLKSIIMSHKYKNIILKFFGLFVNIFIIKREEGKSKSFKKRKTKKIDYFTQNKASMIQLINFFLWDKEKVKIFSNIMES